MLNHPTHRLVHVDSNRLSVPNLSCFTQLRNSYSFLNYDLLKVIIVNDAACSCGAPREDAFHYLFTYPNYTEIRLIMMNNLNWVQTNKVVLDGCEVGE
jgi:hypothetical protein